MSEAHYGGIFQGRSKTREFPESSAQSAGDRSIFIKPKTAVRLPKKKFLEWYMKSDKFRVFRKIRWAKENEIT